MVRTRGQLLWLVVFVAGATFQLWRDSLVDALAYLVVALLIFFSDQRSLKILEFRATRFSSVAFALLLITVISISFPIHSWLVAACYMMLIPILIRISWQPNLSALHSDIEAFRRSSRIWSAIGLLICLCELGNYFASYYTHNDKAYPTITVLVDPIVANSLGKVTFVIIWAGIGVGLLRISTTK